MRRQLSLAQKLKIVTDCRTSGLSAKAWLQEHGIHENTYYNWIKQLRAAACELPEPTFSKLPAAAPNEIVQVNLVREPEAMTVRNADQGDPALEVVLGGASIRVYDSATAELLDMVMRVLRRQVC